MNDQMLHHFMQDLLPIIAIPTMVICAAWVVSLIIAAFKNRAQLRAQTETYNRIMDKFGSAQEFTVYLQSEAGQKFFENLSSEPATPLSKILGSIRLGTILTFAGIGFLWLGSRYTPQQGGDIMFVVGLISLMVGAGFLVSSAISYWLAKSWGLVSVDRPQISNQTASNVP